MRFKLENIASIETTHATKILCIVLQPIRSMHVMASLWKLFTHKSYLFGYTIRCFYGSKHFGNTLNFSTVKQDSTEILMAFASDFSLSLQLPGYCLFSILLSYD